MAAALTIVAPDGSRWPSNAAFGAVDLNPDYWTFAPGLAVSYLDANWLLSANFRYDINSASQGTTMSPFLPAGAANGYVSGNLLFGELTALYKLGKWSFGPVGYFVAQTTADHPGGGIPCTPVICGNQSQIDVGFLIGYDFGPVAVQVWADNTVECANCIGTGWDVWGRVSFRLWAPEAMKPLASEAGVTMSQFALAWVLREGNVASAIVGASRPEQLDENAAAADIVVDPALFAQAEAIAAQVPTRPG